MEREINKTQKLNKVREEVFRKAGLNPEEETEAQMISEIVSISEKAKRSERKRIEKIVKDEKDRIKCGKCDSGVSNLSHHFHCEGTTRILKKINDEG